MNTAWILGQVAVERHILRGRSADQSTRFLLPH